jgi:hypothetical protein
VGSGETGGGNGEGRVGVGDLDSRVCFDLCAVFGGGGHALLAAKGKQIKAYW